MCSLCRKWVIVLLFAIGCQGRTLRVCADPNNLPFSSRSGDGFENKLAELVSHALGAQLEYTWWAERKSFLKNSLLADRCDVVMGVPAEMGSVLTTVPYYQSTYVFVYRRDLGGTIESLTDPRLAQWKIGIHVVGDDYAPPAHALASLGLAANVVGFSLFGPYGEPNPPSKLIEAVRNRDVDVAIVWGPFAGYFARAAGTELVLTPVTPRIWTGVPFTYSISMAVRPADTALKSELDGVLTENCRAIRSLLTGYGIPQTSEDQLQCAALPQRAFVSSH